MASDFDTELSAMSAIMNALEPLDEIGRERVLRYVLERLGYPSYSGRSNVPSNGERGGERGDEAALHPNAVRWLQRSNIDSARLREIYALDIGRADLVAHRIPGESHRTRTRNVALLIGAGEYLIRGDTQFSDETLRETCKHYNSYDSSNYTAYLKAIAAEMSGTKDTGYQLTPRGLTAAAALLRELMNQAEAGS